jgi:uncharacterized protein
VGPEENSVSEEYHLKDQLEQLIRLQDIDNRRGVLKNEIDRIPGRIESARQNLVEKQNALARLRAEGETWNQQKREKEGDLETCEERLSKTRSRQSEIKTNKEYQVHLQEIETLKTEKGRVEEELLILMEQLEELKRKETDLTQGIKTTEESFELERQQLEKQSVAFSGELSAVEKERGIIVPTVEPKLLKLYQQLKNLHRELAVVPIQHGTCGGCHMNIPPQMIAEVKSRLRILTCTQCQRIVYWPVMAEQPTAVKDAGSPQAPAASS